MIHSTADIKVEDFKIIKKIGQGVIGKVYLVKHEKSQEEKYYAMKSLDKKDLLEMKQVTNAQSKSNQ